MFSNYSKIVLVAIQDSGSTYVSPALNALKRLGAKDPILKDVRGSFALVGYAQTSPHGSHKSNKRDTKDPVRSFCEFHLSKAVSHVSAVAVRGVVQ